MSSKGTYYQFILDAYGENVCGYMISSDANDRFFTIYEPTFSKNFLSAKIKPVNNMIRLSKDVVYCYFEISEN